PKTDYETVCDFFPSEKNNLKNRFVLTKLLVRFENSSITNFKSFAFWQIPQIFDNDVEFGEFPISHIENENDATRRPNLVRLEGNYQKNSTTGKDEFIFSTQPDLCIEFAENNILKSIAVSKVGCASVGKGNNGQEYEYRFDIDAKAKFKETDIGNIFSFDDLQLQNIGFKIKIESPKLPNINFDLSKLLVFPKINFDGNGFLSSFPIRLSHFQNFRLPVIQSGKKFTFGKPEFDFFSIKTPSITFDWPNWKPDTFGNLFSFIFDFDLGTLGNLGGLKDLKGQLLIGWTFKGGFAIGFKLNGPSAQGIHLDLFGALKLDAKLTLCSF